MDYAKARRLMVDGQLRTADVTDSRLLDAFSDVPREAFVPTGSTSFAYVDRAIPLGVAGRALPPPAGLARLVQLAAPMPTDVALVVGAGTGYGAAILARCAGSVVALEENAELRRHAELALSTLGLTNVVVVAGALAVGYAPEAPYDVIVLEGTVEHVPESLLAQLRDGGRLVATIGRGRTAKATLFVRSGDQMGRRVAFDVALPQLPGFAESPRFEFSL